MALYLLGLWQLDGKLEISRLLSGESERQDWMQCPKG